MSMIGNYRRITPSELAQLRAAPQGIMEFIYPDDESGIPQDRVLETDKSWQAIHYLLTGDPWEGERPQADAVLGGEELGEEDVGYGPARFLVPDEVRATAALLRSTPIATLLSRYDSEAMNKAEVYPQSWTDSPEDRTYISENYAAIVAFFEKAASAGDAMLLYIN